MARIIKNHLMRILSKNIIEKCIVPHLSKGSRGFEPKAPIVEIIEAILYHLKTGYNGESYRQESFLVMIY